MSHGPRLELRQGQSLVMTQQLQQSIKLLQATALELREFVDQELEKNPFLAQEDEEGEGSGDSPAENETPAATADDGEPKEIDDYIGGETFEGDTQEIEGDYLRSAHSAGGSDDFSDDERGLEGRSPQEISLREHLLSQLQVDAHDPARRLIGTQLIDLVDEAGYIKEDLAQVADTLGAPLSEIEETMALLQRFDPPGVCARSLAECLSLQLKEKNRLDPAMQALLEHLDWLADGRFAQLQKACGVDAEDLKQMIAEIRELNPKPGADFAHEPVQAVEPDVFVRRLPDGNWHIELNMNNFPKIMVNERYYKKITAHTQNKKDKDYFSEQMNSANWLVRALRQRADTLMKVAGELVKQQDAFFRLGVRYLKPMTLKDIAAATGYHESTISRVTNGKFILCPRGTFELKYFFTSALARAEGGGEDVSSAAVKNHIAELIEKENPRQPLSDDEIVDLLKDRNIKVARRTVAKYREALRIPSSPKRRRLKA